MSEFDVKRIKGHYEVFLNGEFYCSCEDDIECRNEIKEYRESNRINQKI